MRSVIILLCLLVAAPLILLLVAYTASLESKIDGSGNPADAQTFMAAAIDASHRYREMYLHWPVPLESDGTDTRKTVAILRGVHDERNPLGIDYLKELDEPIWRTRFDPWGNLYRMQCNTDGGHTVTVGTNEIKGPIVFWSQGPDGENQWGGGDDLPSWLPEDSSPQLVEAPATEAP